ncbi:uncharacterized protein LOC131018697 [Salvia miltiorrhiza]|uniref:uncharacterized protein LOC131018697 n=1 Tax=Salvia miltiorrhiza TaxID=226208 RepID=UPI0025AC8985|nr:uncharacterized protein LOC131018697 [Salvia miltiorrhiza]
MSEDGDDDRDDTLPPPPLIRELGRHRRNHPLCIVLPTINQNAEIKPDFIQVLPKFGDLPGESAHKHLAEFDLVCTTLRPQGFTEDHLRLLTFPHTLQGRARDWLFDLSSRSIRTWNDLEEQFLHKFFPESKAASLRIAISGIKQRQQECLSDYWERFQQLCHRCPNHGFSDYQLLINYFYRGMSSFDRRIVDAACGGSLTNKTMDEAKQLIFDMVSNGQQYEDEDNDRYRPVNRAEDARVNEKLDALTSLVRGFVGAQIQKDNHPNFSWSHSPEFFTSAQPQAGRYAHTDCPEPSMSDILQSLAQSSQIINNLVQSQQAFQQETQAALGSMGAQITQLTTQVNKLQVNHGKLPSHEEVHPTEYVYAVNLMSEEDFCDPKPNEDERKKEEQESVQKDEVIEEAQQYENLSSSEVSVESKIYNSKELISLTFPFRLAENKEKECGKEILGIFTMNKEPPECYDEIQGCKVQSNFTNEIHTRHLSHGMPIPTSTGQIVPSIVKLPKRKLKPPDD